MIKIYLSGPISLGGTAPAAQVVVFKSRFHTAARLIYADGNIPLSPLENEARSWAEYMRKAIAQMMSADAVLMLPDWQRSAGAVIEHNLAISLGIPIEYSNRV